MSGFSFSTISFRLTVFPLIPLQLEYIILYPQGFLLLLLVFNILALTLVSPEEFAAFLRILLPNAGSENLNYVGIFHILVGGILAPRILVFGGQVFVLCRSW